MGEIPAAALVGALGFIAAVVAYGVGRQSWRKVETTEQQRALVVAEEGAVRVLDEAKREAETLRRSAIVSGKEEVLQLRESHEQDMRQRRVELEREEKRVLERESQLDRARDSATAAADQAARAHGCPWCVLRARGPSAFVVDASFPVCKYVTL